MPFPALFALLPFALTSVNAQKQLEKQSLNGFTSSFIRVACGGHSRHTAIALRRPCACGRRAPTHRRRFAVRYGDCLFTIRNSNQCLCCVPAFDSRFGCVYSVYPRVLNQHSHTHSHTRTQRHRKLVRKAMNTMKRNTQKCCECIFFPFLRSHYYFFNGFRCAVAKATNAPRFRSHDVVVQRSSIASCLQAIDADRWHRRMKMKTLLSKCWLVLTVQVFC